MCERERCRAEECGWLGPYLSAKEPCLSTKEPYLSAKLAGLTSEKKENSVNVRAEEAPEKCRVQECVSVCYVCDRVRGSLARTCVFLLVHVCRGRYCV